jgi:hypothetical protein
VGILVRVHSALRDRSGLATSASSLTQTWPQRTVQVIVPNPPGVGIDVVARLFAERLSVRWGEPVIVENLPGADKTAGLSLRLLAGWGLTTSEERAKQGNLFGIGQPFRTRSGARHLTDRGMRLRPRSLSLQLFKFSDDVNALSIEFGKTFFEICDLVSGGIVH